MDALSRIFQQGVGDGAAYSFARFVDGFVAQANDLQGGQALGHVALDVNHMASEPHGRNRPDFCDFVHAVYS